MRACVTLITLLALTGCGPPPFGRTGVEDAAPSRITVGSTLNCSKLIHHVSPVYPEEARKKRIQGIVMLRAAITKTGDLQNITVLEGNPIFIPEAIRVAKQWRYTPCLINSEPVEVITVLEINFSLGQ